MKRRSRSALRRWLRVCAGLALSVGITVRAGAQEPGATAEDFVYRTRPRDTLIGLGKRLLLQPPLWHALQQRNHIVDPRRIPAGTPLRIPYEWLRMSAETASVAGVSGSVTLSGTAVAAGQTLPQGSQLETGADGSVTINLADGSVITLQRSSSLSLDQMMRVDGVDAAHSLRLKLGSGRVETVVKPHRDVGRFEISTPVAVSAVRGTRFRNAFSPDSARATTETLEGAVGVQSAVAAVSVGAGFGTRIDRDQAPLAPVVLLSPPELGGVSTPSTGAEWVLAWPPVAGARGYRVQVSTAPAFQTLAADLETGVPTVRVAPLPDGEYWLRVRSVDGLGLEGPDASRQILRHRLPDPPAPVSPLDGAALASDTTVLAWTDRGPEARYELQVASDAGFSHLVCDRHELAGGGVDCGPLPAGRYVWRIAAMTAAGERGPWSAVHDFKRLAPGPLPDPPARTGKLVQMAWPAVSGQGYRAEISRDADFKRVLRTERLDAPPWSIKTPSPGVYYLRVQVLDADGDAGPFGPARRFAVPVPLWVKIGVPLAVLLIPWL